MNCYNLLETDNAMIDNFIKPNSATLITVIMPIIVDVRIQF